MPVVQEDLMCHWSAMVRVARSVLGSRDDAVECAAASLAQVVERCPTGVINMEAFLVTVAKRRAIDMLRAKERARLRDARLAHSSQIDVADIAEDIAAQAEARWADARARTLLAPRAYWLLRLVADGVPTREVADQLGLTERAVESHLLRARRTMRVTLAQALGAIGAFGVTIRRQLGASAVVAPATVAAALFVLLPGIDLRPPHDAPTGPNFAAPDGGGYRAVSDALTERTTTSRPPTEARHSARPRPTTAPSPRPVRETIAEASPADARVTVYREDSGTHEDGPVEVILACVSNVRVEVGGKIGC